MSIITTPNSKLPRWASRHPEAWDATILYTLISGFTTWIITAFIAYSCDVAFLDGPGEEDHFTLGIWLMMIVPVLLMVLGSLTRFRLIHYVYKPVVHQSYLHRDVYKTYNALPSSGKEALGPVYTAVMKTDAGTNDHEIARGLWHDAHRLYGVREERLREEIPNPYLEDAEHARSVLAHEVKQLCGEQPPDHVQITGGRINYPYDC